MSVTRTRIAAVAAAGSLALIATGLAVTPAQAAPPGCDNRNNNTVEKLLECVSGAGVMKQLQKLQDIATANGGTRTSGSPGYDASADYVEKVAKAAGLKTSRQTFDAPYFKVNSPTVFEQVAPDPATYVEGTDYTLPDLTGAGDATGVAQFVDVVDVTGQPPSTSTSGCEASDFAGFTAGNIALLQRGTCTFGDKAANAAAAGAVAAVIFNEGQPGRDDLLSGTLGTPVGIPTVMTATAFGRALEGDTLRIKTDVVAEIRPTVNVFAETAKGGSADKVLVVGAHLDSVSAGPGINDNGSGAASILEVARLIGKAKTDQTIRFAWWGAEEYGLLGAEAYVASLSEAERAKITGYLNFDMVGTQNYVRAIYDGDDSDGEGEGPGPEGSAQIEKVFEAYYTSKSLTFQGTDFDGRSDYGPFIAAGIPSGGLFTGADGQKTADEVAKFGGTEGAEYDPCYHQECDTTANINGEVLDQNADAIAYATMTLAGSKK